LTSPKDDVKGTQYFCLAFFALEVLAFIVVGIIKLIDICRESVRERVAELIVERSKPNHVTLNLMDED
jgi:hypothetical protein